MILSRRALLASSAVAVPLLGADKPNSNIDGVMIGAQSYSFRDRSLDDAIQAMKQIGLSYCELWSGHIEPTDAKEKTAWRENLPMDQIKKVRAKFNDAGIRLFAVNYSFRDNMSPKELQAGFDIARALGTDVITASSNISTAAKVDPIAQKEKIYVAFHNHSRKRPNEFATPENFDEALNGKSKWMAINLDIGHFVGAGYDPVDYLQKHHDRIKTLHVKDKTKKDENLEFGKGETPIKAVLQLLKAKKYPIPAMIEYEYKGADTVAEVRKAFEYMKQQLA